MVGCIQRTVNVLFVHFLARIHQRGNEIKYAARYSGRSISDSIDRISFRRSEIHSRFTENIIFFHRVLPLFHGPTKLLIAILLTTLDG